MIPLPGALARFVDPYSGEIPAEVRTAAAGVLARLQSEGFAPGFPRTLVERAEGGKMLGVLVVRNRAGELGYLQAFSGQLGDAWAVPGWAPPCFDFAARARIQDCAEAKVESLTAKLPALAARVEAARASLSALPAAEGRAAEQQRRAEKRTRSQALAAEQRAYGAAFRLRAMISRGAMRHVPSTYRLVNARGSKSNVTALFPAGTPPWGTGDCAGPKLLVHAFQSGLTPLALGEFFVGPRPSSGSRTEGVFYPPCEAKCRPLMAFLLDGVTA